MFSESVKVELMRISLKNISCFTRKLKNGTEIYKFIVYPPIILIETRNFTYYILIAPLFLEGYKNYFVLFFGYTPFFIYVSGFKLIFLIVMA